MLDSSACRFLKAASASLCRSTATRRSLVGRRAPPCLLHAVAERGLVAGAACVHVRREIGADGQIVVAGEEIHRFADMQILQIVADHFFRWLLPLFIFTCAAAAAAAAAIELLLLLCEL